MRVVIVDTDHEWRGGQNQALLTAQGLAARGHSVQLACQAGGALEARARQAGVTVHALRFAGDLSPAAVAPLAALLRRARAQALLLNDPHAVGCSALAARLAGNPRRVAVRRVDFRLRSRLSRFKYSGCHRVVAVSQAILRLLEQDGFSADRLRLVYEGVPDRAPAPGGREALAALGVPPGRLVVGNVAALTDHKDHATLLAALPRLLARVPEAHLVVVGDGELRGPLSEQALALGLGDRCTFAGFRADLDALIPAFDVFCLSSKTEGLGTSLLDAMCFSRPVAATAAGGIPEAVEDGVSGRLAPVGEPQALGDALAELLSDPVRREAMGREGRRRFLERFTSERMIAETQRVLEETP